MMTKWKACKRCALSKTRKQVVIGRGSIPCDLLLIGEAPGQAEDVMGMPFVGRSGRLLDRMLEDARGGRDVSIYITNICACRPCDARNGPNRAPTPDEAWACHQRLESEAAMVQAKRVVLLGKVAQKHGAALFPDAARLSHPAFILRLGGAGCTQYAQCVRQMQEVIDEIKPQRIVPTRRSAIRS